MDVVTTTARPFDGAEDRIGEIVERLLRQARQEGRLPACVPQRIERFTCGNAAEFVGPVLARADAGRELGVVVKIDRDPKLLREAMMLRRAVDDRQLPERLREALPAVYAIGADGPDYAYMMEYFEGYRRLSEYVTEPTLRVRAHAAIRQMWSILSETYRATCTTSHRPDIEELYLAIAVSRLDGASEREPLVAKDRPLRVIVDGMPTDIPPWPLVLEQARALARSTRPEFATFVLGSPHLDNVLVLPVAGEFQIKFIDPQGWEQGDWLFDIVKMSHGLAAIAMLEAKTRPEVRDHGDRLEIAYRAPVQPAARDADRLIRHLAGSFAHAHGDHRWKQRHELGVSAKLIRSGAHLLTSTGDPRRDLGFLAVAEGLRRLWTASAV